MTTLPVLWAVDPVYMTVEVEYMTVLPVLCMIELEYMTTLPVFVLVKWLCCMNL